MKELEQLAVFSEELSNKIKNTSDEELERMNILRIITIK